MLKLHYVTLRNQHLCDQYLHNWCNVMEYNYTQWGMINIAEKIYEIYLCFLWFIDNEMLQFVEIIPRER